jgi:quercetin dioxygenase-like cupin family protein
MPQEEAAMTEPFRRIVTGHDAQGLAIVKSVDTLVPKRIPSGDADFAQIWTTAAVPADNNDDSDGALRDVGQTLKGGSAVRVVDLLPGKQSPMHRTLSLDFGIVLRGELELELDGGTVQRLGPGDVVVQRGTNHLWRNPSRDTVCRIVFVLIEASPVLIGGRPLDEMQP